MRRRDRLADDGELVHGTVLVVDQFLRVADGPTEIPESALMAGVGVGHRIAA